MYDKLMKNPLMKMYLKLPLWAKVAVPAGILVLGITLIKSFALLLKVGILAVIVFAVLTVVGNMKKKD